MTHGLQTKTAMDGVGPPMAGNYGLTPSISATTTNC